MVRSLAPGRAKPRQRLQRAVREAVKETARGALLRVLQMPPNERTDQQLDKLLRAVSQFSFFATLSGAVTREVCRFLTVLEARDEQVLCQQGEVGDCMYFVMEGAVDVMVRASKDEGVGRKVDLVREGSSFGQLALVSTEGNNDDSRKRTATCRASGPCVLAVLFRDDYQRLVAQAVLDDQNKLVMALRTVPSLSGAPRADLLRAAVMMQTRPISYQAGEVIVAQNKLAEQLQFLVNGTLVAKISGSIVRQVVVTSMEMVGAVSLLREEPLEISIVAGSEVTGYTLPPHLAKKLLTNRAVATAVEVTHHEEQMRYAERVAKLAATTQLRSSLIASSIKSTQREKEVHPAVRLGRRQLFPNGKSACSEVPQPPNYRSPKSFNDDTVEVQQVHARLSKRMRAAKIKPQREYLPLHSPRSGSQQQSQQQPHRSLSSGRNSSRLAPSITSAFGRTMQTESLSPELPERPAVLPSLIETGRPWTPLPPLPLVKHSSNDSGPDAMGMPHED